MSNVPGNSIGTKNTVETLMINADKVAATVQSVPGTLMNAIVVREAQYLHLRMMRKKDPRSLLRACQIVYAHSDLAASHRKYICRE
jgi:hypothetical protein